MKRNFKYSQLQQSDFTANIMMADIKSSKLDQTSVLLNCPLSVDGRGNFTDSMGRTITLKGINMDSSMKIPTVPRLPSHEGNNEDENDIFWDGENISFVGRPFPLDEAETHFNRIKSWGFNTVRYLVTWEALEHEGPGQYDLEYIEYTIEILKIIKKIGGLYVFLEPHQDVWSRYSGGSGAPLWTFYAAGLNPKHFNATEAAITHNSSEDPSSYPKMIWTSNYFRLAASTMFTLFFGGKMFAPNAIIDGVNIQDYLQSHFLKSLEFFWSKVVQEFGPDLHHFIMGFENINEPNNGLIGHPDLSSIPSEQQLRIGTTPTPFQSFKLGMGIPCEVDVYHISVFGPKKNGTQLVDPQGKIAWVTDNHYDLKYGFKRDKRWRLGECIFAQHGVWDLESETLLKPKYFAVNDETGERIDENYFVNHHFVNHYKAFKESIRKFNPDVFILLQPPVLKLPPKLIGTDLADSKTVYCPHYYDGMSLMFKTWNTKYNVDTLGIMRGRYSNPIFSIVLGESNIRKCIRNQFIEMRKECQEYLGDLPILMSETGMPFDMDDKKAYDDGDYRSQTAALDALGFALEGSNMSHTYWCYNHENNHKWGDNWNCEDFSFWSKDDSKYDKVPDIKNVRSYPSSNTLRNPSSRFKSDQDSFSASISRSAGSSTFDQTSINEESDPSNGVRAVNAIIRPYAASSNGNVLHAEFDLKKLKYILQLNAKHCLDSDAPTLIYFPKWHFNIDDFKISLTSGYINHNYDLDVIEWYHESGPQELSVEPLQAESEACYFSFW